MPEDDQSKDEITSLTPSTPEREAELQEWCLLSVYFQGSLFHLLILMQPMVPFFDRRRWEDLEELKKHIQSRRLTKSPLCKGCLTAGGPRRVRDVGKATHVLHTDIAEPLTRSDDGFAYFLVGALRLPGFPLLIDVQLLQSRTSAEVLSST